jgi:hypothetical protein
MLTKAIAARIEDIMTAREGTAAQISTFPMDVRHFEYLLPHQIRAWGSSVDRIVVTIDTHRSRAGRYRGSNFDESLEKLRRLVNDARKNYPQLQVADVDYSEATQRAVARYFFDREAIPPKAWDSGYFYPLFYGLYVANAQYVMHFDGDMMFGGGSTTWMQEAIACMEQRSDVLVVEPFPGPPRADGRIVGHENIYDLKGLKYRREDMPQREDDMPQPAYRFNHVSSRAFVIDVNRFEDKLGKLPWVPANPLQKLKARILGNPPEVIAAEDLLTKTLQRFDLYRIDMLGSPPGMWSLHPPYRSEEFYRRLPEIIRAVETGDVPEGQRGHYDLNDSIIDWTSARAANQRHRRYMRMIRDRLTSS